MQVHVIERTFRIAGESALIAQFTFITTGTVHVCFPGTGLQMEAHRHQIRIEDCTIIYTEGLHYGQRRALWALTLHAEDIEEFQNILSGLNSVTATLPPADRKRWVTA